MSTPLLAHAAARAAYAVAGAVAGIWTALALRVARDPRRRLQLRERLGRWDERGLAGLGAPAWIHAASLGEVGVANRLAAAIRERQPGLRLLLTCNTTAGLDAAAAVFDAVHCLPLDRGPVVRKVLDRVSPSLYVFVETEIWPVLLLELAGARVPAAMVNARISDRSFPRYRMARSVLRPALATLAAVCARDEDSRARLLALGAREEVTTVCGDLKLDARRRGAVPARETGLRGDGVLVAASVRRAEIAAVVEAFRRTREHHADARLVVAPRYLEDSDAIVAALRAAGDGVCGVLVRRSDTSPRDTSPRDTGPRQAQDAGEPGPAWDVLVLDTHGELVDVYPDAVGAFVGGTLDGTGGHNVVEPAAAGLPIVVGPALANVREHAAELEARAALRRVADAGELAGVWCEWLSDPARAASAGRAARAYAEQSAGALERTMAVLGPLLDRAARVVEIEGATAS